MNLAWILRLPIVRFLIVLLIVDLAGAAFVYTNWRNSAKGPDTGWMAVFAIWMYVGALVVEVLGLLAWAIIAGLLRFL